MTDEDPILRKKSREIGEITDRIRTLVEDMWETMYDANGIGLAAPQVGVLRRIVVIDVGPAEEAEEEETDEEAAEKGFDDGPVSGQGGEPEQEQDGEPERESIKYAFVNPEIVEVSGETVISKEGCLSVPGMVGDVERPVWVKVQALDIDGNSITVEGEGILAKALLHEIDHLNGILYTDIAESVRTVEEDRAGEDDADE